LACSYRRVFSGDQAHSDECGLQRQEQALKDWMSRCLDFQLAEELLGLGISAAYTGRNRLNGALRRFFRQEPPEALKPLILDVWGQGLGFAVCSYHARIPPFRETTGAKVLAMLSFLFAQAHSENNEKSSGLVVDFARSTKLRTEAKVRGIASLIGSTGMPSDW